MIKLEEPKGGDIARAQNNDGLFFLAFNANKRSLMAIAILAAINQRHATGRGRHVEVSMQEAVLNLIRVSVR